VKFEVGVKFEITFLTQYLDLSLFDPNLGSNNRLYSTFHNTVSKQ